MSLLIEKNMRTSGPKLVPGDVKNVDIKSGVGKVSIKWTDPDDTTYENYTFIKWKGTILVKKYDSPPTSINDGIQIVNNTVRNRYASSGFNDNNHNGSTGTKNIYYRFFTYSVKNKYNDSSNMIYNTSAIALDPVFGNNSWDNIISAAESDNIPSTWKIGDEKDIVLEGSGYNENITLQIWDFDHFDKSDGTGKAKLCLGMKHLMIYEDYMNDSDTNNGGWDGSDMKSTRMRNIELAMPNNIRSHIKEVKTEANAGNRAEYAESSVDKVFIPGYKELGFTYENYDGNQVKFPIFSDNNFRIKKMNNGSGEAKYWWTRSPFCGSGYSFRVVYTDGGWSNGYAGDSYGVCFCFNI